MSQLPAPKISRAPRFSVVWLVPLVALAVGGWMVFRELHNRGPEITIHFPNGSGVEAGKTSLMHKGVVVGTVRDVALEKDLSGVVVKLQLYKEAAAFAHTGAQFWIVRPEVTFSGVRGLETLIAGVQLNGRPGSGPPARDFKGLEHQSPPEDTQLGRAFLLRAAKLGSLTTGAPVYYREVKVGAVETSRLANDAADVMIRIRIYTPYVDLVRTNTQFWNAGGVAFKVSLLGAELKSTSLESLFTGGIGFATPDKDGLAPVAADGAEFTLHDELEKEWLKWQPRIPIRPLDSEPAGTPHAPNIPAALKD
jgi:paraquat-inducible protein B